MSNSIVDKNLKKRLTYTLPFFKVQWLCNFNVFFEWITEKYWNLSTPSKSTTISLQNRSFNSFCICTYVGGNLMANSYKLFLKARGSLSNLRSFSELFSRTLWCSKQNLDDSTTRRT